MWQDVRQGRINIDPYTDIQVCDEVMQDHWLNLGPSTLWFSLITLLPFSPDLDPAVGFQLQSYCGSIVVQAERTRSRLEQGRECTTALPVFSPLQGGGQLPNEPKIFGTLPLFPSRILAKDWKSSMKITQNDPCSPKLMFEFQSSTKIF